VPDVFRERYAVPASAPIVGPCAGGLNNGGETVKLLRPFDGPGGSGAFIVADRVSYDDEGAWPGEADGLGPSLERLRAGDYGNDPINWSASLEAPGTPGRSNGAGGPGANQRPVPAFSVAPQASPLRVSFDASASRDPDGSIRTFAWSFGDGSTGSGQTVLHDFPAPGSYTVRLRAVDDGGAESTAVRPVTLSGEEPGGLRRPGDLTGDGKLDLSDPISLLHHLFLGEVTLPCEGADLLTGGNQILADVNGDDRVDLSDPVAALLFLYCGGAPPALGVGCILIAGCSDACTP
jgi:hypothetical protein